MDEGTDIGRTGIIDGIVWEEKQYSDNPLIKKFLEQFGGYFMINPDGFRLRYEDDNRKPFQITDKEQEFLNLITQSIEQGKNLFLGITG
jgi:hypothetical protein